MKNQNFKGKYDIRKLLESMDDLVGRLNDAYNLISPLESNLQVELILNLKNSWESEFRLFDKISAYHDLNKSDFLEAGLDKVYDGMVNEYEKSKSKLSAFLDYVYRGKIN